MDGNSPGGTSPLGEIDAADLVVLAQAPCQKSALTARNSRDEDLFHRHSEELPPQLNPSPTVFLCRHERREAATVL